MLFSEWIGHSNLPHCPLYATPQLVSGAWHRDCPSRLSHSWSRAYWMMLSWGFESLLNSFGWNRQAAFQHCVGALYNSFFVQPASRVWDILGIFHQTYVASILLYMLWLLHLMIVLNDVTFMVQRDSLRSTAYSGNCWGMMNSICLPGTDFCFKFSVLSVLGYHIYVD